jgi:hypothetical protein
MKRTILTAIAAVCMAFSAMGAGDLKITYDAETKAMMRTQKSTQVHYYSSLFMRINDAKEQKDTLVDFTSLVSYEIDHKKKLINFIKLEDMTTMMELLAAKMAKGKGEETSMAMKLLGDNSGASLSVVKGGNEVIAGRACTEWTVSYGKMVNKFSADPSLELPVPPDKLAMANSLKDAAMMMVAMILPGLGDGILKLNNEIAKIKGVHLKIESTMPVGPMTMKNSLKATKIEEGLIPASVFELPGYKQEDMGKQMLEDMKKERAKKK